MPARWCIEYWPECIAQVFLSHCAEDRHELVLPVYAELELMLRFPPADEATFQRSLWRSLVDKSATCPHALEEIGAPSRWLTQHVVWAADIIERFVRQEEGWAFELTARFDQDETMRKQFEHEEQLMRRLLAQAPRQV
jgi:hypothetical protein